MGACRLCNLHSPEKVHVGRCGLHLHPPPLNPNQTTTKPHKHAPNPSDLPRLPVVCAWRGRGSGRGDSLLDYVEQDARQRGIQRLVLLTTRTADWFEQRDFRWQVRCAAVRWAALRGPGREGRRARGCALAWVLVATMPWG